MKEVREVNKRIKKKKEIVDKLKIEGGRSDSEMLSLQETCK